MQFQPGIYRHYKGALYSAKALARHSETKEWLVIYHDLSKPEELWVRPYQMFVESVLVNGENFPRFELIDKIAD